MNGKVCSQLRMDKSEIGEPIAGVVSIYEERWVTIRKATPCTPELDRYPVAVKTSSVAPGSKSRAREGYNPSYFISGCLCCPYA